MQDRELEDCQKDIETNMNIGGSFQYSPNFAMELLSSPRETLEEILPLSPMIIEESNLDQLWRQMPEIDTPDVLQPKIKKVSIVSFRSRNGLKVLSWKVKEIVELLGSANYRAIADELIKSIDIPISQFKNDEKNIRRRVYDALNVLVAAQVIQKQGKNVIPCGMLGIGTVKNDALKCKREQLKALVRRYVGLKNLFERNCILNKTSQALSLPLILISIPKHSSYELIVKKYLKTTVAVINSSKAISVFKETAIITMMGLHNKVSSIPQELKLLCGRF